jgi:hypothetical protein
MRTRKTGVVIAFLVGVPLWGAQPSSHAGGKTADGLAAKLRELDARVVPPDSPQAKELSQMLARDIRERRDRANRRESAAWEALKTRADWEHYRDQRIKALRDSLGIYPEAPKHLKVRVTRTLGGEGYRIENLVFESRPGLLVTANLYLPTKTTKAMPGILICHSHHNPKTQGELQDMGMTWARLGCAVLVMDQLGHGERRQHPYTDAKQHARPFKPGRQDYYFRYNVGNQLYVIGDSLIGWMAWDMMRGVDLLLSRPGIDKDRIILLGAVAGGGDPAAVTAALDKRIAAAVPFNFGGPQPETTYPLPADAKRTFNYAGGGSWESTRNLRLSARDGFLPWVIVGSLAPRGLVYAHEFAWDREHDPVWARLGKIYDWYGPRGQLAAAAGKGSVRGKAPESTHCNNIGAVHRKPIYAALQRWLGIPTPEVDYQKRRPAEELLCLTPEAAKALRPRPVYQLAAELGAERAAAARKRRAGLPADQRREQLGKEWERLLGPVAPGTGTAERQEPQKLGGPLIGMLLERVTLTPEPGIKVPLTLLVPSHTKGAKLPVVVAVAQEGKEGFLKHRAETIAALLRGRVVVCLPDLRGTGETRPAGDSRGRTSASTSLSASELMLGRTLLGGRVRDLRTVLAYLRTLTLESKPREFRRWFVDTGRIALWGDSFAAVNPAGEKLDAPLDSDRLPKQAEPLGGLVTLFTTLYEPGVRAVYARGGLSGYAALLESQFLYVPHDALVPGALTAGDLADVAAALAPRPLRLEGPVDGLNRRVSAAALTKVYAPASAAYRDAAADA